MPQFRHLLQCTWDGCGKELVHQSRRLMLIFPVLICIWSVYIFCKSMKRGTQCNKFHGPVMYDMDTRSCQSSKSLNRSFNEIRSISYLYCLIYLFMDVNPSLSFFVHAKVVAGQLNVVSIVLLLYILWHINVSRILQMLNLQESSLKMLFREVFRKIFN